MRARRGEREARETWKEREAELMLDEEKMQRFSLFCLDLGVTLFYTVDISRF